MAQKFNPGYSKMLSTPVPSVTSHPISHPRPSNLAPHFPYTVETKRLRYAQNSHVPASCLPPELLSEAFLYVVESGLQDGDASFALGTLDFLQVCRRWHEVAVNSSPLWVWWVAGAVKACPLFRSRSEDAPILLTWRPQLRAWARDTLMGPVTPRRIRRFDFSGADKKLQYLLTVCHLDILFGRDDELVGIVGGRYYHGLGLTRLVVRSCRVH